jgi:hypothetical protein
MAAFCLRYTSLCMTECNLCVRARTRDGRLTSYIFHIWTHISPELLQSTIRNIGSTTFIHLVLLFVRQVSKLFISIWNVHGGRIIESLQPPQLRFLLICLFIHRTILVETSQTACATRELDLVLTTTDSDHYKPLVQCKDNTIHHCYIQSDTH